MKLSRRVLYTPPDDSKVQVADADLNPAGGLLVLLRHPDGKREALYPKSGRRLKLEDDADYARMMPDDRLLVISIRQNRQNGRIYGADDSLVNTFDVDAPVCDALVDWIDGEFWVSYFRMGFGAGLAAEGLVRFDTAGRPIVKFASEFSGPESRGDAHPFCVGTGTTIWLFPDPDFALMEIDWNRWKLRSRKVPYEAHGADAICARGRTIYMAGGKQHPHTIFAYQVGKESVEEIGRFQGRPRPIQHRAGVFIDILKREVAEITFR